MKNNKNNQQQTKTGADNRNRNNLKQQTQKSANLKINKDSERPDQGHPHQQNTPEAK